MLTDIMSHIQIPMVGYFEKVSFEQFKKDILGTNYENWSDSDIQFLYDSIELPKRATKGSAGYDIRAPHGFLLNAGESIKIPTGLRVHIADGWFLGCMPRSGLGFKYEIRLANTFGVVDSDYINAKNEGHIFVKLHNGDPKKQSVAINRGDGICQAIFLPFGIATDDTAEADREGGFGSTGM